MITTNARSPAVRPSPTGKVRQPQIAADETPPGGTERDTRSVNVISIPATRPAINSGAMQSDGYRHDTNFTSLPSRSQAVGARGPNSQWPRARARKQDHRSHVRHHGSDGQGSHEINPEEDPGREPDASSRLGSGARPLSRADQRRLLSRRCQGECNDGEASLSLVRECRNCTYPPSLLCGFFHIGGRHAGAPGWQGLPSSEHHRATSKLPLHEAISLVCNDLAGFPLPPSTWTGACAAAKRLYPT